MTPREAYTKVLAFCSANVSANTPGMGEALTRLERLVAKDEDEAKALARPVLNTPARHCTCGTSVPCAVWGHS